MLRSGRSGSNNVTQCGANNGFLIDLRRVQLETQLRHLNIKQRTVNLHVVDKKRSV